VPACLAELVPNTDGAATNRACNVLGRASVHLARGVTRDTITAVVRGGVVVASDSLRQGKGFTRRDRIPDRDGITHRRGILSGSGIPGPAHVVATDRVPLRVGGAHVQVLGRTELAMSTNWIRRVSSDVSLASAR
jgi:hypothetical protein